MKATFNDDEAHASRTFAVPSLSRLMMANLAVWDSLSEGPSYKAGLQHDRSGFFEIQAYYVKAGFVFSYRNVRHRVDNVPCLDSCEGR